MAYNATYTSDDTSPIVLDAGNKIFVQVGSFAGLIGLVVSIGLVVFIWKKNMR